jgi:hypothetical protein
VKRLPRGFRSKGTTVVESNMKLKKFKNKLAVLGSSLAITVSLTGVLATTAKAETVSHNYVNSYRSSDISHLFVSQSIEGEYGEFELTTSKNTATGTNTAKWRGYNLTQTFGLEVFKFIQFNLAHSMMNMRSSGSALERLGGSRFSAGARLVFLAPVANLEAGGGVIGTRYDYQHDLSTSDFYGSGVYYSLGFNYFMNEKVSLFGQAKTIDEHSIRNGGDAETKTISARTTNLGVGFTLWL